MKYGILKIGDVVRYNKLAKLKLSEFVDNDEHIITKIDISDGIDDVDEDTTGNEHVEWENSTGCDAYWLERVKTAAASWWGNLTTFKREIYIGRHYSDDTPTNDKINTLYKMYNDWSNDDLEQVSSCR